MPRAELRLRLLSKVGEAIRVPTDQSWTSNSEGFTILRTAHRNASSQLQAYVRRLLQKRFTRNKGVAACQHILDHIQLLVQKGQAGVLEAYGEGVMALLDRPHKTLTQQQVLHRMLERARLLQATFRRKLAQNRRCPPPPDKNAASGWTHVTPLSASAQHVQRRQEMADWSALVETPQTSTCIFGAHHLPSNRAAMPRPAQLLTGAAAELLEPQPLNQVTDSNLQQQAQIGVGQQVRVFGLQVQYALNGGLGHIVRGGHLSDRYAVRMQKTGLVSLIKRSNLSVETGAMMHLGASYDRDSMPSQHQGFLRRTQDVEWRPVSILVDSGSQQPPLLAKWIADSWHLPHTGTSAARQAGGALLPIYEVGRLELAVNGKPTLEHFSTAPIAPYDVILGEGWLLKHKGVLDYATPSLYSIGDTGQKQSLRLDDRPDTANMRRREARHAKGPNDRVWERFKTKHKAILPLQQVGRFTFQSTQKTEDNAQGTTEVSNAAVDNDIMPDRQTAWQHLCKQIHKQVHAFKGLFTRSDTNNLRTDETHSLHSMRDDDKFLPEDADLEEIDIPGMVALEPGELTSFQKVIHQITKQLVDSEKHVLDQVKRTLAPYEADVFEQRDMPRPPPIRTLDLEINERDGAVPQHRQPYKVAAHHQGEMERQIGVLLKGGIIRESTSAYSASVLFTPKPGGALRMCIDCRRLNDQTHRDRFPTPCAQDLIARTQGATMFSKIDLHSGFHQMRVKEGHQHKTAFSVPGLGLFEWVGSPFGLSNTPGAFQRLMQSVLRSHIAAGYCLVYCDDIIIFGSSPDPLEHLRLVEKVLSSLREHSLLASGKKCEFFKRSIEFLGFVISEQGVAPIPSKVEAIVNVPAPETVSQLRSFLGMTNFFASHIPLYSERAAALTDLLKGTTNGRQRVAWTLACEEGFQDLKQTLCEAPVLRHFNPKLRTAIHVDGSQKAVGAVLLQWEEGEIYPRPVCFLSKKLAGPQYRYDSRSVESLAVQVALSTWRQYLYGIQFEIFTDHQSLQYLYTQHHPSQRVLRLCEFMATFDFKEVRFVRGSQAVVPDFLSRPFKDKDGETQEEADTPEQRQVGDNGHERCVHALAHPHRAHRESVLGGSGVGRRVILLPRFGTKVAVVPPSPGGSSVYTLLSAACDQQQHQAAATCLWTSAMYQPVGLQLVATTTTESLWEGWAPDLACARLGVAWLEVADLPTDRAMWGRTSFEALRKFGVYASATGSLCMMASTTMAGSSLLIAVSAGVKDDAFLARVAQMVKESDDGRWRGFFRAPDSTLRYHRDGDETARICVPSKCRGDVMRAAHGGDLLTGHPGIDRTLAEVSRYWYWPTLARDVAHFCRSCRVCAGAKAGNHRRLGMDAYSEIPLYPFSHWSMDLISMPVSKQGNDLIVTWVDRTSKTIVARALKESDSSTSTLAKLTFEAVCCRFGVPHRMTHDNDVRFKTLWEEIMQAIGTKLSFTSSYNPQADPAERANRQVLEALRAAASSVCHYDAWDEALPHLCFGLNTHVSSATGMSPFELAHGFPARVPMTLGIQHFQMDSPEVVDVTLTMQNRLKAAADQMAAAQVRVGLLLAQRATPALVRVGDRMWLDGAHVSHQLPYKLACKWFGPYEVLEVRGHTVRLNLPASLGKTSDIISLHRLKFYEQRDACFGEDDGPVLPLLDPLGVHRYEIKRILLYRFHKQRPEYLVEWTGFDASFNQWIHRDVLDQDVPEMVRAYDENPSPMLARPSAPKRTTTGRQIPVGVLPVRVSLSRAPIARIVAPPVGALPPASARALRVAARVLQSDGV